MFAIQLVTGNRNRSDVCGINLAGWIMPFVIKKPDVVSPYVINSWKTAKALGITATDDISPLMTTQTMMFAWEEQQ
jgi:hypothetical protein